MKQNRMKCNFLKGSNQILTWKFLELTVDLAVIFHQLYEKQVQNDTNVLQSSQWPLQAYKLPHSRGWEDG